jgi:1-acyl-sn-glycerol-3-phosphate acyltransferase
MGRLRDALGLNAKIDFRSIPEGGFLLVSNHRSHLDAFILLSKIRGIKIMARRSLFSLPGIGTIMSVSRQIPVEEQGMGSYLLAMETVRKRLRGGETVHVFPEMTRCPHGFVGTLDFSPMPFHIARQEGIPILPIVFKGTDSVWPRGEMGLKFRRPVVGNMLDQVDPKQFNSTLDLKIEVQRRIAEALQ